ncbi:MAG: glycosyltransferase family 39 protein [Chloroflexota bacterium]|nr:glycosyltransferase family 39 protein [Chloroflexota bacterium]
MKYKTDFSQYKLLFLIIIVALGSFLRLYQLGSLPFGASYDEAYYGLDALDIIAGARPIFFATNFGREALFSYLVAPLVAIFGISSLPLHLAAALVGILTLPVIYLLGEELFAAAESSALRRWGALFATGVAALSYWHLNWSRYGVRAILVPLFATITLYFLWRGLEHGRRADLVQAGFWLGLSSYTYQAARLLPFLVLMVFSYRWLRRGKIKRHDLKNLLLVGGVSLLVFLPLGYYFVRHPQISVERVQQVYVLGEIQNWGEGVQVLAQMVAKIGRAFFIDGDRAELHNLPGRPLLNPFLATLLAGGIIASLRRWRKPKNALLLTWVVVMCIPAFLAGEGPVGKRALGAFPAIALLITLGVFYTGEGLSALVATHRGSWSIWSQRVFWLLMLLGMFYTGGLTYYQYFEVWANETDFFRQFEAGVAGEHVRSLPAEEAVYVSPLSITDPRFRYYSGQREDVRGYNGRTCFVFPRWTAAETTYLIVPGDDQQTLPLLTSYFPATQLAATGPEHHGQLFFQAYRVPAGVRADFAPSQPLEVTWGAKIHLLGYDLNAESYRPGESLQLTLYYEPLTALEEDYTVFVHLLSAERGEVWGQRDSEPCQRCYPTSVWRLGEVVRDQVELTISAEAVPGLANLQMGFYLWPEMEQLPVEAEVGQVDGNALMLTQLAVSEP